VCWPSAVLCLLLKSLAKLQGPVSDWPLHCIQPATPTEYTGFTARPWTFGPAALQQEASSHRAQAPRFQVVTHLFEDTGDVFTQSTTHLESDTKSTPL
jgi:hypothetical protein